MRIFINVLLVLLTLFWMWATIMAVNDPTNWNRRQQAFGAAFFAFMWATCFWLVVLT